MENNAGIDPSWYYFDRDISWLKFNERVLTEAARSEVPLLERIKFLSIYSSNLDEFYRVRMPVLHAFTKINTGKKTEADAARHEATLLKARQLIQEQQQQYGKILTEELLPLLKENNIHLLYNVQFPQSIRDEISDYFFGQVLAFLQPVNISNGPSFFPENNKLYFLVLLSDEAGKEEMVAVNIPSDNLPRFTTIQSGGMQYIVFIDDIIRHNLDKIFKGKHVKGCYSFKITREAELDLNDEYPGDISEQIEKQLSRRDYGIATRFLHSPGMPLRILNVISRYFNLQKVSVVEGGIYHNLKDLSGLPVSAPELSYEKWPRLAEPSTHYVASLLQHIEKRDVIFHAPYHSYQSILRFFNEAAIDPDVQEINVTLYRVASDSRIANALISAARNGKKVQVVVELKARFDEANNIKWAKVMRNAGVKIIYSVTALKIHAKVALVKRNTGKRVKYTGLLATGNFNESTAAFYTDHILMTSNPLLLREMDLLFMFLARREKPTARYGLNFDHLLVAGFNLQQKFIDLIDREIAHAKQGRPAYINIKLNNLEEQVLINKLYEASQAGVKIALIVRSICCLVPGIKGMSEHITIRRVIDRYLEHGRVFVFGNNGQTEVYMGSADWMNRNIYRRIEVCFPVLDRSIKDELLAIIDWQLTDNTQAVMVDRELNNVPVEAGRGSVRSQYEIYRMLSDKTSVKY
jgi:polyphosphate kinase